MNNTEEKIEVILTRGLPASGKTTWAKELMAFIPNKYKRINKDDLRAMLDNSLYSKGNEKFVLQVRDQLILAAIENGKHVIIDDTNLASKHEDRIRSLVKYKANIVIKDFSNVPLEQCIERDLKRANPVGEKVIRQMYNQFLRVAPALYTHTEGLPLAVICDLDGTLSLINGRNPYDASNCDNDILNVSVANIIKGHKVLLVSGREDKYKEPTLLFLEKHGISYEALFMRKSGDYRKDSLIKKEIFEEEIRNKWNIEFVVDDRLSVCRMWYELGLPLFRVGDPDGDF